MGIFRHPDYRQPFEDEWDKMNNFEKLMCGLRAFCIFLMAAMIAFLCIFGVVMWIVSIFN